MSPKVVIITVIGGVAERYEVPNGVYVYIIDFDHLDAGGRIDQETKEWLRRNGFHALLQEIDEAEGVAP